MQKKNVPNGTSSFSIIATDYSSLIAPTGQPSSHCMRKAKLDFAQKKNTLGRVSSYLLKFATIILQKLHQPGNLLRMLRNLYIDPGQRCIGCRLLRLRRPGMCLRRIRI